MFSIFKKASQADRDMTVRSILKLSNLWVEGGYKKFYLKLIAYHHDKGDQSAVSDSVKRMETMNHLISESLRACNNQALFNQKVQTMVFTRVSTALNLLEQQSVIAYKNDLPFKELIPKPSGY